jgi:hypothetical protein
VSDRRLTLPDGQLFDDLAVKAIVVACADSSFSISYSGLAIFRSQRTDEWVIDTLAEMGAGLLPLDQLLATFHDRLASVLKSISQTTASPAICFILAGFCPRGPFFGELSNVEDIAPTGKTVVKPELAEVFRFRNTAPLKGLALQFTGAVDALDPIATNIRLFRRKYLKSRPREIADALVGLVRIASDTPPHGRLIGKNCLASIVHRTGDFESIDYSTEPPVVSTAPHGVLGPLVYKHIRFRGFPGSHFSLGGQPDDEQ